MLPLFSAGMSNCSGQINSRVTKGVNVVKGINKMDVAALMKRTMLGSEEV